MHEIGTYRIHLDGRWGLNDLYDFPHALAQTYAFAYCFESDLPPRDAERIDEAMRGYPWGGGYSVVNIYTVLQNQVPHEVRPQIQSIKYASPGWLDLLVNIDVITTVAAQVAAISTSIAIAIKSCSSIQKMLQDISLQKRRSQLAHFALDRSQAKELRKLCDELAKLMEHKKFAELVERTGGNIEVAAKILSAQFRRLRSIVDYKENGKALIPSPLNQNRWAHWRSPMDMMVQG